MEQIRIPYHLLRLLNLPNPDSCNIYLVGSRLWGTHNSTSDWDLLIVSKTSSGHLSSTHKCQYDVKLLDLDEFIQRIRQGSIVETICALLRTEDVLQSSFNLGDLSIDLKSIKVWLEDRRAKDLEKAEKFWLKGNRQSGWKILRHILHTEALYNYLAMNLPTKLPILTIAHVQDIVQPATLICDKAWIDSDWPMVREAVSEALKKL